jgi:hypothetical protein
MGGGTGLGTSVSVGTGVGGADMAKGKYVDPASLAGVKISGAPRISAKMAIVTVMRSSRDIAHPSHTIRCSSLRPSSQVKKPSAVSPNGAPSSRSHPPRQ